MGLRLCMCSMLCRPVSCVSNNSSNNALLQQPAAVIIADCHPVVILLCAFLFLSPLLTLGICWLWMALDHRGSRPTLRLITSPLADRLQRWHQALSGHPDKVFARYVLEGLREGFCIGFTPASTLFSAPSNMQLARLHPTVISDYISKEVEEGRTFGPGQIQGLHINRMGVVPRPMEADHQSVSPRGCQRQ